MRVTTRLFASVLAFAGCMSITAFGCGSSQTSEEDAKKEEARVKAKDYYISKVHPIAASCVSCHGGSGKGPTFMADDATASYGTLERTVGLIAEPARSPLVQYKHTDKKVVATPEQRNAIAQWLSYEATARGLAGAIEKPKTITDAYKKFATCMNFDIWQTFRMGDLAFTQTDTEGPCLGCHSTGQGSAFLSATSRETFDKAKQFPYIQKLVVGKLDDRGSFEELVASGRYIQKSNEGCPPGSTSCHPRYGLPPNVQAALETFVATTLQNLATDNCQSGIVVEVPDAGPGDAGDGGK
jgi:mono/diheme cytochrome c family protein